MKEADKFPDAVLLMILQMREEGWTFAEIAKHYKTSHFTISRAVREIERDYAESEAE